MPTKVCLVKAMVFPVVMYGRESWTQKKAERTEELMLSHSGAGEKFKNPLDCKKIKPVNPEGNQS